MECLSHYWQNQLAGKSLVTGLALGVACGYGLFVRYVHVSSVDCDDEAEVTQGAARIFSRLKKIKNSSPTQLVRCFLRLSHRNYGSLSRGKTSNARVTLPSGPLQSNPMNIELKSVCGSTSLVSTLCHHFAFDPPNLLR